MSTPASPSPPRRRRSRLLRILLGVAGGGALLVAFALWLVTRSWFIIDRVTPVLEEGLGSAVTVGAAEYLGNGAFSFRDVSIRARGIDGPGGEVCRIDQAEVVIAVGRLLAGRMELEHVLVNEVRLRISERATRPGVFNFMALDPNFTARSTSILPRAIQINRAVIEVGEHDGDRFALHGIRALSGSLRPDPTRAGSFSLTLVEVDGRGQVLSEGGLLVDGRWNVATNAHVVRIADVEMSERALAMCPRLARVWWNRMELSGRVAELEFGWSPGAGLRLALEVDDVGLTLPIETGELWARYRAGAIEPSRSRPRMHVDSGKIELTEHQAALTDLEGHLLAADDDDAVVGVPYSVNLRIDDLGELDWEDPQGWLDRALATAPFDMTFRADGFRVGRSVETEEVPAVILPEALARVLEKFRFTDWALSTSIEVARGVPEANEHGDLVPQSIRSSGQAYITDASGTYEKFPYPLTDVEGYLEFDNEQVIVHHLNGAGADGTIVRLGGVIRPPGREAEVKLRLTARNMPIDERLRDALKPKQRAVFDSVIHRPSFEALWDAGRFDGVPGLGDEPPFELGGMVDLDLRIDRPPGAAKRTVTTGRITVRSAGLLDERFPYPLQVGEGVIEWTDRTITVREPQAGRGLPVVTPGGGRGTLRGSIEIRPGDFAGTRPDLTLTIEGDTPNELLYAAIPPSSRARASAPPTFQWPGGELARGAEWLRDLQIAGALDYEVRIFRDDADEVAYEFDVELSDGEARPAPALARLLGIEEGLDESDWLIEACSGLLRVGRDSVELVRFEGRHRNGAVSLDGQLDLPQGASDLAFVGRFRDLSLDAPLLELLPPETRAKLERLWEIFRPEGTFDADVVYQDAGEAAPALTMRLRASRLRLDAGGSDVILEHHGGNLIVGRDQIEFDEMTFGVRSGAGDAGTIVLRGGWRLDGGTAEFSGVWNDAPFESPFIPALLRALGEAGGAEQYEAFAPRGRFDAAFTFEPTGEDGPPRFSVDLTPHDAAFVYRDVPIHLDLEKQARVSITPGRIELSNVSGRHDGGVFDVSGVVTTTPALRVDLGVEYDGRLRSPEVLAVLPAVAARVFEKLAFEETADSTLDDGRVLIERVSAAEGDDGWRVTFGGRIGLEAAGLRAGIPMTEITGSVDVELVVGTEQPLHLQLAATPDRMVVLGQALSDVSALIVTTEDGRRLQLREFRARGREGIMTAAADVGIGDETDYVIGVQLVGMPLGDFFTVGLAEGAAEPEGPPEEHPSGEFYARIDLAGDLDDRATRTGRGSARVLGGKLARVPLVLQLINVLQFTVPAIGLDYAESEFFIAGDRIVFEHVLFESTLGTTAPLSIQGIGEVDLSTLEINSRFNSRSAVAVLSEIVGGIGDQFMAIEVTGPLADPQARLVGMPGFNPVADLVVAPPLRRGATQ